MTPEEIKPPKPRSIKFKCNCGDTRCGSLRVFLLGDMLDVCVIRGTRKEGIVLYKKDITRLKKFLNK